MRTAPSTPSALPAVLGGMVLGAVLIACVAFVAGCGEEGFREVEDFRDLASEEEIATWTAEYVRRAVPWNAFPDPPGVGPVVTARYWVSRPAYEMEVRRRGDRITLGISGIDKQLYGGGWTSFGEGRITGGDGDFRGAVARISWSCLGIRYRHASDGVARITFTKDGRGLAAVYVAHEASDLWMKAYGRILEGPTPAHAEIRGQIPYTPAMPRLKPGRRYAVAVRVLGEDGRPIAGALARLKGKPETRAVTDAEGRAVIAFEGREAPWVVPVCAAAEGFLTSEHVLFPDDPELALMEEGREDREREGIEGERRGPPTAVAEIRLIAVPRMDHPAYVSPPSAPDADAEDAMACGTCHSWQYDEWVSSRHARSADHGHVEAERLDMRRADPLAPDDCRGCHQPGHALDAPGEGWARRGSKAGVHCDLCHKVAGVSDVHASGVYGALDVVRPDPLSLDRPGGIHHVFGPTGDVTFAYMGASYAPIQTASEFCGGCHQGGGRTDLGVPKIQTYEEWRLWAASQPTESGRSCQDCHMPGGATRTVTGAPVDQLAWDALHRTPSEVHSHRFPGATAAFAAPALELSVLKRFDAGLKAWEVEVAVKNVGAGHKIPTGTWSKHVVVGVWARAGSRWLRRSGGDVARLLETEGPDEPLAAGDWRNPGGLVLRIRPKDDKYGRLSARFWGAWKAEDVVDERLAPGEERRAVVRFEGASADEVPDVEVQVVHRRGEMGAGPAGVPWEIRPYDPPPQTLWMRVVR